MQPPREPVRLIIIVGASRSGTTMLNRVLGAHHEIVGMQEMHYFGSLWNPRCRAVEWSESRALNAAATLFRRMRSGVWSSGPQEEDYERARAALRADSGAAIRDPAQVFLQVLTSRTAEQGARLVTEQTPGNVFFMRELAEIYPDARFIHVVRDPRAVTFSQRERWRKRWLDPGAIPLRETVRNLANYHPVTMALLWKRATLKGLEMEGHPRYRRVRYEEMVADPEKETRSLCEFVGVEFDEKMLDIPRRGSSHAISSITQGFDPALALAWSGRLSPGEVYLTERLTESVMRRVGYSPVSTTIPFASVTASLARYPLHLLGVLATNPRAAWEKVSAALSTPEDAGQTRPMRSTDR